MSDIGIFIGVKKLIGDYVVIVCAWMFAYFLHTSEWINGILSIAPPPYFPGMWGVFPLFLFTALWFVFLLFLANLYDLKMVFFRVRDGLRVFLVSIVWGLSIVSFYSLYFHDLFLSRRFLVYSAVSCWVFVCVFRIGLGIWTRRLFLRNIGLKKIFLIGDVAVTGVIAPFIEKKDGLVIVEQEKNFSSEHVVRYLSTSSVGIDEIWYVQGENEEKLKILNFCQINHIGFRFIPNIEGVLFSQVETETVGGFPIFSLIATGIHGWGRVFKRGMDIVFSLCFLLLFSPVYCIIAIFVLVGSRGPVFYGSERVGKNGETFIMYKFRSMRVGADMQKGELLSENIRDDGPLFKMKNDPRVTKVGGFLRRFSLDEIPQFWNVLRGDMSIIGPRAHLPEEVEKYSPLERRVLMVRPGISGLPQVSGRSDLPFSEEIRLDLQYISSWSLFLDCVIILKTPFVLMFGRGAD